MAGGAGESGAKQPAEVTQRTFRMVAASTLAVHAGLEEKIGVGEREAAVPRCLGTRLFQGRTPDPEPKALH